MNIDDLVILVQVTLILLIGLAAVRLLQPRLSDLSAKLGVLTLLVANLTVLAGVFHLPRLYTFQFVSSSVPARVSFDDGSVSQTSARDLATVSAIAAESADTEPNQFGFLSSWLNMADRWNVDSSPNYSSVSILTAATRWIMLGFGLLAIIWLLLGNIAALRVYYCSRLVPRDQWPPSVLAFCMKHGIDDRLSLRVHRTLVSPCVYACCSRTIFVPLGYTGWSQQESLVAFAHEWAHLQRRDPIWRLGAEFCLVLLAWHPLSYLVRRQLMLSQEMATDLLAAESLGSPRAYQTGLSQLLLRLDSPGSGLQVSLGFGTGVSGFSSSLVRRIKMLDRNEVMTDSARRRWRWAIGVITCGLAMLVGGWNVVADEPPRVAALANSSGKRVEPKLFARRKQLPSDALVNHTGAIRLDVSAAIENPLIKTTFSMLDFAINSRERRTDNGFREKSPSEYGFSILGIQTIEAGVEAMLSYNSPERRELSKNSKKLALSIGSQSLQLITKEVIDWKSFVSAIDPGNIPTSPEVLAEFAATLNTSDTLTVGPKAKGSGEATERSKEFDALWNLCDGGFFTAVMRSPTPEKVNRMVDLLNDEFTGTGESISSTHELCLKMASSVSYMGVGLDHTPGSNVIQGRIIVACNPETQIDEVGEFFRDHVGNYIKESNNQDAFVGFLPLRFPDEAQFEIMVDPALGEVLVITVSLELLDLAALAGQQ